MEKTTGLHHAVPKCPAIKYGRLNLSTYFGWNSIKHESYNCADYITNRSGFK